MSKLLIIDGHAIMHRAFHAIPPLATPKGEPINAVHGLVSMLLKIIQDIKPTSITVAFDEKAPTFRNKLLPTYQSQRPPMVDDLSGQFEKVKAFLSAAGIPTYSLPGYEADDVIGTIVSEAAKIRSKLKILNSEFQIFDETIIVTGDKDQLQLVDDALGIKLYMPIGGLVNGRLFGEKETIERIGVGPNQIPDLKALIGDQSDNYKGVAGIGPVTAINLLAKYNSINNIYDHLDEISPNVRRKLEAGKTDAELSFRLATIVRDVPIKFDFPQMKKWNLSSPDVITLFEKDFGFRTLTDRIKKIGKQTDDEKQGVLF